MDRCRFVKKETKRLASGRGLCRRVIDESGIGILELICTVFISATLNERGQRPGTLFLDRRGRDGFAAKAFASACHGGS